MNEELAVNIRLHVVFRRHARHVRDRIFEAALVENQFIIRLREDPERVLPRVLVFHHRYHLADARLDEADQRVKRVIGGEKRAQMLAHEFRDIAVIFGHDDVEGNRAAFAEAAGQAERERRENMRQRAFAHRRRHDGRLRDFPAHGFGVAAMHAARVFDQDCLIRLVVALDNHAVFAPLVQRVNQRVVDINKDRFVLGARKKLADKRSPDISSPKHDKRICAHISLCDVMNVADVLARHY